MCPPDRGGTSAITIISSSPSARPSNASSRKRPTRKRKSSSSRSGGLQSAEPIQRRVFKHPPLETANNSQPPAPNPRAVLLADRRRQPRAPHKVHEERGGVDLV